LKRALIAGGCALAGSLALTAGASAVVKSATGPGGPIQPGLVSTITFTATSVPGKVTDVNASINGITHTFPEDIEATLTAPSGASVQLLSDAADGGDVSGVNLTFDDSAPGKVPFTPVPDPGGTAQLVSGTFQPSSYPGTQTPGPDPDPLTGTSPNLAGLAGGTANGNWILRVTDDYAAEDVGSYTGSALRITTAAKKKCKKKKGKKGAVAAKCGKKKKRTIVSTSGSGRITVTSD
jgi:subtilisin-like proprotein convertase family protein